ncbi:MAG: UDP-N-acetylglucosamine 4,6-dehydratase (inverting) [Gaiellaceae bacterium]
MATSLRGKTVLVTGGTGSFGSACVRRLLADHDPTKVIVFSRDEWKQSELTRKLGHDGRLRCFLGDVRDRDRLQRALAGVDVVVHAAALKQVPTLEYNPFEAVKTNIYGAQNVIDAAIDAGVERVIALSTDKASSPVNLYGATKLVSDKLFVDANAYAGDQDTALSVVRYGNVVNSRGSVIPLFRRLAADGRVLPLTDERMTRFVITLEESVEFVLGRLLDMHGGELFVPKLPSVRIGHLAAAVAPGAEFRLIGIRPGEKLHEELVSADDARRTRDAGDFYVVEPEADWWHAPTWAKRPLVPQDFRYASDTNGRWLEGEALADLVRRAEAEPFANA